MHGIADQVDIPGDDIGCAQDGSKARFARDDGCFLPAPLGKERCESECSQGCSQHGHLGGEHAVRDWLARVAIAADFMGCRPDDGGADGEYGPGGEYRPAARASQSSSGNKKAAGAIRDQDPVSRANANPLATDTMATANVPSSSSRHDGASRTAAATPISSGATVMTPSASDANQTSHTSRNSAVEGPKSFIAPEAPRAAVAVATAAATRNPSTRRRLSRLKWGPNQRSISHITKSASPALHKPKGEGAPDVPVAHESGCDACAHHRHCHWHTRPPTKRNQDPGGDARGGPEHSHAFRGGEESKAQLRGQEIRGANCDGNSDAEEPPSRFATYSGIPLDLLAKLLQYSPPRRHSRSYRLLLHQRLVARPAPSATRIGC